MEYDFRRYNQYDVLRVNWLLWLVLLYMTRHTLVLSFLLFAAARGSTPGATGALGVDALFEPLFMIADIPALALIFALGARVPQGGAAARAIWRHGKTVILASIAIYFAAFLWRYGVDAARFGAVVWLNLAANLAIAALVIRSRYLADLFAQFPEREEE